MLQAGQQPGGETNATTKVSIAVLDVNDNGPQFSQDVYLATVQENTPSGVPLTMSTRIEVEDHDQVRKSGVGSVVGADLWGRFARSGGVGLGGKIDIARARPKQTQSP